MTHRREIRTAGLIPDNAIGVIPTGAIIDFGGSVAPDGFLACDGSEYLKTDYPDLFAAIGIVWGENGNNFKVPDFRDSFAKGKGASNAVGDLGGSNAAHSHSLASHGHTLTGSVSNHTLTTAEIPSHRHTINHGHSNTFGINSDSHDHTPLGGTKFVRHGIASHATLSGVATERWAFNDASSVSLTSVDTHNHGISGGVTSYSGYSGNTGSNDSHGHGDTFAIATSGILTTDNNALDNQPKFCVVLKIIKY